MNDNILVVTTFLYTPNSSFQSYQLLQEFVQSNFFYITYIVVQLYTHTHNWALHKTCALSVHCPHILFASYVSNHFTYAYLLLFSVSTETSGTQWFNMLHNSTCLTAFGIIIKRHRLTIPRFFEEFQLPMLVMQYIDR